MASIFCACRNCSSSRRLSVMSRTSETMAPRLGSSSKLVRVDSAHRCAAPSRPPMRNSWWRRTPGCSRHACQRSLYSSRSWAAMRSKTLVPTRSAPGFPLIAAAAGLGVEKRPVTREQADGVGAVLDDGAEQALAAPQRFLGSSALRDVEHEGDRLRRFERRRAHQHAGAGPVPALVLLLARSSRLRRASGLRPFRATGASTRTA